MKTEFIGIIKAHEGLIYKVTRVYALDSEDQKDLYQEIVFQLWKSFGSFRGEAKIGTWMYRIALNTALTYEKKRKRKGQHIPLDETLLNWTDEQDPVMQERMQTLYAQIHQLNLVDRGLILLFLEGKSYEEIAAITGFSKSNVGTRLNRIKNKLKSKIKT